MIQHENCKNPKEVMAQLGDEFRMPPIMEQMQWNGNPVGVIHELKWRDILTDLIKKCIDWLNSQSDLSVDPS